MIAFIGIEGHPPLDQKKDPPIGIGVVDGEYFKTLKIPLLSGRQYDARDGADGQKVTIVNQAFAKRFFPNGDALGKRVTFGCEESEGLCRTIVGVVGNIRQESITDEAIPELYLPFAQMPMNGMTVMVRTTSDPLALVGAVRNEVLAIDKNQPIYDVKTLAQRVDEAVAVSRSLMLLFTCVCVAGAGARRGWNLRNRFLLGNSTHTRDRNSHGARRASRQRAEFDHEERIDARVDRNCDWHCWRARADAFSNNVAVWSDAD